MVSEGFADRESRSADREVRRRSAESGAHQPGGMSGEHAVRGDGPDQTSRAGHVCRAADAALAVRRHRAGRRPGGGPRRDVPVVPHGRRVRARHDQLAGRVQRVRLRRDAVHEKLPGAQEPTVPREQRPEIAAPRGRVDGARRQRRGGDARARTRRVPRRRGQRSMLLRGGGRRDVRSEIVRAQLLSGRQR